METGEICDQVLSTVESNKKILKKKLINRDSIFLFIHPAYINNASVCNIKSMNVIYQIIQLSIEL